MTPENSDPAQLTGEPTDVEATAQAVKELAMRAYSAARQALDLRRDLAARLNMSEGPFSTAEKTFTTGIPQPTLESKETCQNRKRPTVNEQEDG